jgi:hypothetical protein
MNWLDIVKICLLILSGGLALSFLYSGRDLTTGKINWFGHFFIVGATLSIVLGVIAQLKDSRDQQERDTALLKRTEGTVNNLSRLLEAIDQPRISLFLGVGCDITGNGLTLHPTKPKYQEFCSSIAPLYKGPEAGKLSLGFPYVNPSDIDWSKWPDKSGPSFAFRAIFFKDPNLLRDAEQRDCLSCLDVADMEMTLSATNVFRAPSIGRIELSYSPVNQVEIEIFYDSVKPTLRTRKIIGLPDLDGATLVLSENVNRLDDLRPTYFNIENPRGESRTVSAFQRHAVNGHDIYTAVLPIQQATK